MLSGLVGLAGLDGLVLEPEPALDGALLEPDEDAPDGEDEGDDGSELLEDEPLEERSREAPGPLAFLSQPYRPLTATAMGRRTTADFLSKFIWGAPLGG